MFRRQIIRYAKESTLCLSLIFLYFFFCSNFQSTQMLAILTVSTSRTPWKS